MAVHSPRSPAAP